MTLNITLLTRHMIYQSADFRLTDLSTGRRWDNQTVKIVQLTNPSGLHVSITYTGYGESFGDSTAEFVARWLRRRSQGRFTDVVDRLQEDGTRWLRRIARAQPGFGPHTFVVAGFDDGLASAAVISNFENARGVRWRGAYAELQVSYARTSDRPHVLITGALDTLVSRQYRRMLERLAARPRVDGVQIRLAMQDVNRRAHDSLGDAGYISRDCYVTSFDVSGQGESSGAPVGQLPAMVMGNVDVSPVIRRIAEQIVGPRFQIGSATFATSQPRPDEHFICAPELSKLPSPGPYVLHELVAESLSDLATAGVGTDGTIAGAASPHRGAPPQPCVWKLDESGCCLPTLSGSLTGRAVLIDPQVNVIGNIEDDRRNTLPCRWTGPDFQDLSLLPLGEGLWGEATCVNQAGNIGGHVSFHPTERGQAHQQPVIWTPAGELTRMDLPDAASGTVRQLNNHRVALVSTYTTFYSQASAVLWHPQEGVVTQLSDAADGVQPIGLTDGRRIIGFIRVQPVGAPRTVERDLDEGGWRNAGVPVGWYPGLVDAATGAIAGTAEIDGLTRPWIKWPGETAMLLPSYAYHNHELTGICSDYISGVARADHGWHALRWTRRPVSA